MTINKTNLKTLLGISATTYDNQIDMLIPQILDSICDYCKNDFLLAGIDGYVYDNPDMTITSTTITLTTDLPILAGDFIRIYGTAYNDGLYQVKTYTGGIITIETQKTMRAETVTSAVIALIDFPIQILNVIAAYIKNDVVSDGAVKMEEIDDVRYDYFQPFNSLELFKQNASLLSPYKKVYRENVLEIFITDK